MSTQQPKLVPKNGVLNGGEADAIVVDGAQGSRVLTLPTSEEHYRVLAEHMNEGAVTLTTEGTILFCNQRFAEMVRVPAERLLGSSLISMLREEERQDFPRLVRQAIRNNVRTEGHLLRNSGNMLPVLLSLSPIPLEDSGQGICLVATDLSDQKRVEEAARQNEILYRTLLESLPQMVFAKDSHLRYISCNQNYAELLGISREEFAGKTDYDFFPAALADKYRADDQRVMQSGIVEEIVEEYASGGNTMTVQTVKAPFRDADGNTVGVLGIFWDITTRSRAEQKLREQAALLDLAHDAILVIDMDGRIRFWNRGATELYGWEEQKALGKVAHELLQTGFPDSLEKIQAKFLETGRWEGELQHTAQDGKVIITAGRWSVLRDEHGEPTAVMEINRDITARYQAERQLRKASLYTRSLIEASLDPLVTISREGKITDVNEATENVTGVARDRLIGSDFCDHFTEPEKARQGYEKVFEQGSVQDYPLAIRHVSGKLTDVLYNATIFKNEAGEVEGVFAAARDITEKKRAQATVAAEREKFNTILDVLPPYVILLTPDYHVAFANREFRRRFGESGGRRCFEFLFSRDEPCEVCETYKVLQTRKPLEWQWTGPDGCDYEIHDFPFTDSDGTTLILEMGLDVTDRKRAERALLESEEAFRTLAELAPQLVWMCTPDGLNVYFNQRWVDYTGMTLEESHGRGWNTPFHPDDKQPAWDAWDRAVATGNTYRVECRLRAVDGSYRWFLTKGVPLCDSSGKIVKWFGTCTDIDDLKRAQEELHLSNEKLEQRVQERTTDLVAVNKELEAFAYAVAHDLRAPLRHIHGFSDLLLHDGGSTLSVDSRHWLDCILNGTSRMEKLLEDLLNLSRLGRQPINRRTIPLKTLVQEVIDDLAPETSNRQIEWKLGNLPPANCDPALLKIVFINLLSNAVKFTRPRSTATIEVGHRVSDGKLVLFVRDNGAGFDMKYADKLFGVFQRLHLEKDFEGTGIGLATVNRILQKHGGRIWAEAELDKGATFYFTLGGTEVIEEQQVAALEAV